MTQITYISSALRHSSAMTTPPVALTQFGLWNSIKNAFKKYAKPLAAVVGIVASIAVPFIAPAVAGFIFGGTALATGAIGAAIAGAGLGAAAGALTAYGTGQNVLMGAGLGLVGGAIGGGLSGYSASGTMLGASGAQAAGTTGMTSSAANIGGAMVEPASASIGGAAVSTVPGQVGMPTGMAAADAATTASKIGAAAKSIGSKLLDATLTAAPSMIGTVVSGLSSNDAAQAQAEMLAEMQRTQANDIEAYNRAKTLYNELVAQYGQIDPTAAAQRAEADVIQKTAMRADEGIRRLESNGGASSNQYAEAEQRRLQTATDATASGAYTDAYYKVQGDKLTGMAGLRVPTYQSNSYANLQAYAGDTATAQRRYGQDIARFISPYTVALNPYDSRPTSTDTQQSGRITEDSLTTGA